MAMDQQVEQFIYKYLYSVIFKHIETFIVTIWNNFLTLKDTIIFIAISWQYCYCFRGMFLDFMKVKSHQ